MVCPIWILFQKPNYIRQKISVHKGTQTSLIVEISMGSIILIWIGSLELTILIDPSTSVTFQAPNHLHQIIVTIHICWTSWSNLLEPYSLMSIKNLCRNMDHNHMSRNNLTDNCNYIIIGCSLTARAQKTCKPKTRILHTWEIMNLARWIMERLLTNRV